MNKLEVCIYCGEANKKFCKAHILPRSLGAFENQPTLLNKICAECDTEIGKSEDQFTHSGLAALLRTQLGLAEDEQRSPFRRRFAGQGPIDMKINYLGTDGVLLEPSSVGDWKLPPALPLPQIHFIYADGNKKCIRINPESFTVTDVLQAIEKKRPKQVIVLGVNNEQYKHISDVFRQAGIPFSGEQEVRPQTDEEVLPVLATGNFIYDKRYLQAIAKIGFHYYLGMNLGNCYLDGSEDVFNLVRRFIRYGEGDPEAFVKQQKGYFVDNLRNGWRPPYYGHIFRADVSNKCIMVKAQFFVGPNIEPPYYEVLLCQKPFIVNIRPTIFGHNYEYIEPDKRNQFAGTIHQLGVNNRIIIPP
ncbi:MAG: hypothetical protein ABSB25_00425 [Sedimentisphaerales bacterium]|jgi:hypothetical protein